MAKSWCLPTFIFQEDVAPNMFSCRAQCGGECRHPWLGLVWFGFLSPLIVGCNLFWSKFFLYVLLLRCHGRRRLWLIGFVCVLAGLERVTPLLLGPPVNPARWCFGPWVMGTAGGHREPVPNPGVIWFLGLRWLSG